MKSIGCDIIKVERFKNFLENKKKWRGSLHIKKLKILN